MPGYGVKVVEPLKATLICPECKLLLRDALQTESGILLCESCFKQILQYPNCTSPRTSITIGKQYYLDKAVRREISQLVVLCSHVTYGCPWQGQLQYLEGHCRDCKYKPVSCPNPGCSELLDSHVDVDSPFRKVTCNYCEEETAANQLEDHLNQCPKVPVKCGRCPEWVGRDSLEEHQLKECPYVECPVPGCGEIVFTGGARELHPISNGNFNQLVQRGQIHPYPTEASSSCSLHEVEYFQPTFGVSSFIQHNRCREVEKQPIIQILQDGTFLWRIPEVSEYKQNTAAVRSPPS